MATFSGVVVATSGAGATGRRTLNDIVDELIRPFDASDETLKALAEDAFREAVRTVDSRGLWPWEIQDESVTTTNGTPSVTLGSTVKKPLAMHYTSSGNRNERIKFVPYNEFVEKYTLNINGRPTTYTLPNNFELNQVRFHPIPGAAYNLQFTYYRRTPLPRLGTEVVEIPEGGAMRMYMAFAWYEFLKRTPSAQRPFPITVAMSQANDAFSQMSAMVTEPGDMSRTAMYSAYGAY